MYNKKFLKNLYSTKRIKKLYQLKNMINKNNHFNDLNDYPYFNFNYHYKLRLIKTPLFDHNPKRFKSLKIKKMFYLRKSIH